jgi:hypothetical protein
MASDPDLDSEPAEGSRETVNEALERRDRQQGITNRPLEEEQRQQAKLPPRGEAAGQDEEHPRD